MSEKQNWLGPNESDREGLVEVQDWLKRVPVPEANQKEESPPTTSMTSLKDSDDSLKRKRRVKIMMDCDSEDHEEFYSVQADGIVGFPYSAVTWDNMAMGLRIALHTRTLYSCDGFLSNPKAKALHDELLTLRKSGFFDVYLLRSENCEYACVKLTQPEVEHRHIDGLILIVYKLAQYFSKQWTNPRVNILYFPKGMPQRSFGGTSRTLTCIYCCTPGVISKGSFKLAGSLTENSEHKFDRLVAFWRQDGAVLDALNEELYLIEIQLTLRS